LFISLNIGSLTSIVPVHLVDMMCAFGAFSSTFPMFWNHPHDHKSTIFAMEGILSMVFLAW